MSVGEMHKTFIANWNNSVKEDDTVYILEDIAEEYSPENIAIIKGLAGRKTLILGNHDDKRSIEEYNAQNLFEEICQYKEITINEKSFVLFHYPIMDWNCRNDGYIHIYGHIHNKSKQKYIQKFPEMKLLREYFKDKQAYNCSADITNFTPKTFEELQLIKRRT